MYSVQYSSKLMQCNACRTLYKLYCIADVAACSALYFQPQNTANCDAGLNIAIMNVTHTFQVHLLLHYKSWRVYGSLKTAKSFATQKSYSRESCRHDSVSVLIAN